MTAARAQPLLADSELTKAHDFLFEAHMLVTDVKSLFRNSGDFVIAARLKDIQDRLDERSVTLDGRQQRLRLLFGLCRRRAHFRFGRVIRL